MILNEILKLLEPLGYPLRAFGTEIIEDCVVYSFVPVSSDCIKEVNRLEITVISKDMQQGLNILEEVKKALLTFGDEQKTDNILEVVLNGGGSLENLETDTVHFKAFFVIKSKYRKE